MASHEKQNVAVVRRFIDGAVNGRDPAVIEETWSDDLLWRGGSLGMFDGKAAFKSAFIANATRAWDDMLLEIHEVIANDDKVVMRFTNSGTNVGPFMSNSTCLRFRAGEKHGPWPAERQSCPEQDSLRPVTVLRVDAPGARRGLRARSAIRTRWRSTRAGRDLRVERA